MIREERSAVWWAAVYAHPAIASDRLLRANQTQLWSLVSNPRVKPLAAEHGGFIFLPSDALGRVYELHTAFTPEGWGREVVVASHEAFARVFSEGAQLVYTWECAGNWRSRPPLSHGWRAAGDFALSIELAAEVRTWVLTQAAWEQSPVRRRLCLSQEP